MRLQFFRMGFLKRLNCFIIGLKLVKLFFVLLHTTIEATFEFFDLAFIVLNFSLLILLELLLFSCQALLIFLELLEAFFFVFNVLRLKCSYLVLPRFTFLGPSEGFLLSGDHSVGTSQKGFNFLFIRILDGSMHCAILLVLAMQMEDHFSQLSDLL